MTRPRSILPRLLAGPVLAFGVAAGVQAQSGSDAFGPLSYRLFDPAPLDSLSPGADARWRLEATTGLSERQQLRLSTGSLDRLSPLGLPLGGTTYLDARATWRYTVYQHSTWAWRLGLTSPLGDSDPRGLSGGRTRLGGMPQLHLAGDGSLARNWLMGFSADTLMTARGYSLDLGLRVSYQLAPNVAVVGGYRLSDNGFEGDDYANGGVVNSANVGVRLRF
jgi:hypothetical protein